MSRVNESLADESDKSPRQKVHKGIRSESNSMSMTSKDDSDESPEDTNGFRKGTDHRASDLFIPHWA